MCGKECSSKAVKGFFKHHLPSHAHAQSRLLITMFKQITNRSTSNSLLPFTLKTSGLSTNSVLRLTFSGVLKCNHYYISAPLNFILHYFHAKME